MTNSVSPDSLDNYLNDEYERLMEPEDYFGGLNALISHDIYNSAKTNPGDIKNIIQAEMLVISAVYSDRSDPPVPILSDPPIPMV